MGGSFLGQLHLELAVMELSQVLNVHLHLSGVHFWGDLCRWRGLRDSDQIMGGVQTKLNFTGRIPKVAYDVVVHIFIGVG